jgi:hypothetical protein
LSSTISVSKSPAASRRWTSSVGVKLGSNRPHDVLATIWFAAATADPLTVISLAATAAVLSVAAPFCIAKLKPLPRTCLASCRLLPLPSLRCPAFTKAIFDPKKCC